MFDDETRKFSTPPRSFESIDDARFVPGTILADRYRIIGLLATMTAQLFFFLSVTYPLTTDFSAWYASSTFLLWWWRWVSAFTGSTLHSAGVGCLPIGCLANH